MTSVTFETATLQVAVKKAARIAPSKGAAFDKASGIVIDVQDESVVLRATNLDVYYMEWVDFTAREGENVSWRLPASVLNEIVGNMPISSGSTVTLKQEGRMLLFSCGRLRGKLAIMDIIYYPIWYAFDPDEMFTAQNFGGRMAQAEWAADKTQIPICGLYMDGNVLVATNRFQLAIVDMPIENFGQPITFPAGILSTVLKQTGDIEIGVDSNQLLLMPDEHTQIRAVVYDVPYPDYKSILARAILPQSVTLDKTIVTTLINQAMSMVGSNRNPKIKVFIGREQLACMLEGDLGHIGNVVDIPGQALHERVEIHFTPSYLTQAIEASSGERFDLKYNPEKVDGMVAIDSGGGYQGFVMARRHNEPLTEASS